MRRVHLFLCIGGLAVIASYVLVVQAVHPSLEASAPRRTPADAGGDGDSSALTELVPEQALPRAAILQKVLETPSIRG